MLPDDEITFLRNRDIRKDKLAEEKHNASVESTKTGNAWPKKTRPGKKTKVRYKNALQSGL